MARPAHHFAARAFLLPLLTCPPLAYLLTFRCCTLPHSTLFPLLFGSVRDSVMKTSSSGPGSSTMPILVHCLVRFLKPSSALQAAPAPLPCATCAHHVLCRDDAALRENSIYRLWCIIFTAYNLPLFPSPSCSDPTAPHLCKCSRILSWRLLFIGSSLSTLCSRDTTPARPQALT